MSLECNYFQNHLCRSCQWIEFSADEQIAKTEKMIRDLLPGNLEPSVRSPSHGFRNRVKMSVTGTTEHPLIGLLGKENLDQGQDLTSCPIQHPELNQLFSAMPEFIRKFNLIPYHIESRTGELKGFIAFYSQNDGEMYLRFILRSKECISRIKKLVPELQTRFPKLLCISANIQAIPHAILEGPEEIILTAQDYIHYTLLSDRDAHPTKLKLAPQAFVQTNTTVANKLYSAAAQWIGEIRQNEKIRMLELFCGQGAFSFTAIQNLDAVLGIEVNEAAVKTATETAAKLKLPHLQFKAIDVNDHLGTPLKSLIDEFKPNLILANPPRRGLSESLQWIDSAQPTYVIYSSCEIKTLAADIQKLAQCYVIHRIQLFDLFPHTEHFETLVLLKRKVIA